MLADLVARGLKPDIPACSSLNGAKALSCAVRDTFGDFALIQRCQIHKGRNIIERLRPSLRLHQRDREPNCPAAADLPQRQTLARCTNGLAMDGNCNAGGREKLSPFEGPQAASLLKAALQRHQHSLLGDHNIGSNNLAA